MSVSDFPVIFVTHGAGPMMFLESEPFPVLGGIDKHSRAAKWFRQLSKQLALPTTPKAILVVSAHWETSNEIHINAQEKHNELYYDYYGFPSESYEIKHNSPGDVNLAKRVQTLLQQAGIVAKLDDQRNLDHGVFIPLKLAYPEANIPVVSMSILKNLSPSQHLAIGKALAPLRKEQVLIIGSGSSIHGFKVTDAQANAFANELTKVCTQHSEGDREKALLNWEKTFPYARMNHPREEHFIPLHVIVGAAGSDRGQLLNPEVEASQAAYKFGA